MPGNVTGNTKTNTASLPLLAQGRKKKWSYSSLCFSLFYFVPIILMQNTLSLWVMAFVVAGFFTFVSLYIICINQPLNRLPYYLSAMVVLAYATSMVNLGGTVIFGYFSFIIGYYYRFTVGIILVLMVFASLAVMKVILYPNGLFFFIASGANITVLFGFGIMERKETLFQRKEAQHAAALGTLSAIAERERIGRDLHDVAGHALSSISLKAQLADKLISKGRTTEAQAEVKALAQLSQQLLSEIRQTVSGIKHLSLSQEITKNRAKLSQQTFDVHSNVEETCFRELTPLQETQISLIIKEATTNILRHSNGDKVTLSIRDDDGMLHLVISDNGSSYCQTEGNGVQGIRERAELINANVEFQWGSPTILTLQLPLPTQDSRQENDNEKADTTMLNPSPKS